MGGDAHGYAPAFFFRSVPALFKGRLEADYDVFQQMGPIVDPFILPGYLFVFKKMSRRDVLARVVI